MERTSRQDAIAEGYLMFLVGRKLGVIVSIIESPEWIGLERAMIYKTLVLTGLRANELRTLECRDLSFGDVPFVKLRHSNEKSGKGSSLALRSDLAAELRE